MTDKQRVLIKANTRCCMEDQQSPIDFINVFFDGVELWDQYSF